MTLSTRLAASVAAGALTCALFAGFAQAQEITGGISGKITDAAGHALKNATVSIVYKPTHVTLTATTGADGFYSVRLPPGGPYEVTAVEDGFQTKTVEVDNVSTGDSYDLDVALDNGTTLQALVVTAKRSHGTNQVQMGPSSDFSAAQIAAQPSFSQDLKDTARLNPFVTIDPTNSNAIIIAGNNNHVNTIYVDGVRQNDIFGLNGNGYPTQRSPFGLDIVGDFSVLVAPYDVQYGDFQGGVLNITTKSGTNEFHGGSYYQYDSSDLGAGATVGHHALHQPACANGAYTGTNTVGGVSTACGGRYVNPNFQDKEYDFYLGGPIVKDKLFFFFDYDKYESATVAGYVPTGVAGTNPISGVTATDVATVSSILKSVYNYNAGSYGGANPVQNTDYFGKIDWYITNNQHLFVSYQKTDGTTLNTPDDSTSSNLLGLSSTFYIYEQLQQVATVDLNSHWNSDLSTEFEYVHDTVTSPSTLESQPFAFFKVTLPSGSSIETGPDISRQANNLSTQENLFKGKFNYNLGQNVITGGYEFDAIKESDLFVQYATGSYTFTNKCGPGLNQPNGAEINLQDGVACSLTYANAYTNNPETAAGDARFYTHTFYLQDEWHPIGGLRLRAGLRFDLYQTPDKPLYNPVFQNEYGFANNLTVDGENVLQPRAGFNWRVDPTLTVYGGVGLFAGGNPGVYIYDSYDNPGNLIGTVSSSCAVAVCPAVNTGITGSSISTSLQQQVAANANAGAGISNSLDPHFHPPADWKASLGLTKDFGLGKWGGPDWTFHLDYLYQKTQYAVNFVDLFELANTLSTTAPDGRPEYNPARYSLTTTTGPFYSNSGVGRTTGYDIELTDTDKGFSNIVVVGLTKKLPWGLTLDYTFTHETVKDVSPATSSVALSNYSQNATANPNNPGLGTSNYEIPWENKLSVMFDHKFFGDNHTIATLFMQYRAGQPFSYTFNESGISSTTPYDPLFGQTGAAAYRGDQLLYVPKADSTGNVTATSDPRVTYLSTFNVAQFNAFLHSTGLIKYQGQISPRNAFFSSSVTTADVHLEQEIPVWLLHGAKVSAYLNIINLPNLLNSNWGTIYSASFPYFQSPVVAKNCQAVFKTSSNQCQGGVTGNFYEYGTLKTVGQTLQNGYQPATPTYAIQVGARLKF